MAKKKRSWFWIFVGGIATWAAYGMLKDPKRTRRKFGELRESVQQDRYYRAKHAAFRKGEAPPNASDYGL